MNAVEYAVALFENQPWTWDRDAVKAMLLAAQATFARQDEENERDLFTGPNGEPIMFVYGQDPRVPFVEILLKQQDIADLDEAEADAVIDEYDAEYETLVASVCAVLGDYAFEGTCAGSPLTEDHYGDLCACWVKDDLRFMVQELQLDTDLPIQLSLFIAPKI